jgi:pSer/pThr/pTyr-binding forkhead associated (FHA) protein
LLAYGGRRMPVSEAVVTIGRSLDNDIVIQEASVSRRHAQLRRRYGQYVIYDLGSSGGTLVNGHRVREAALDDGDVVSLGGIELRFERLTGSPLPTQEQAIGGG